ncbi:neutral zinc metallopeptidase [Blastococcus sp. SYSU D00820]
MTQVLRRATVAAAAGSMLLAGCSSQVDGTPTAENALTHVTAEEFPITGATDSEVDQYARDALTDLVTFWEQAYPEAYGESFPPLEGGFFSVDSQNIDESAYPDYGIGCERAPVDPAEVTMNAHYDPNCDVIAYDTQLLTQLSEQFGQFIGPAVMAHEMGHAIQGRVGFSESSIQDETQADCFAGAFTRWVADGNGSHVGLRVSELDPLLGGFIYIRDEVGSDPNNDRAHGSGFDRVSGFYAGFSEGVLSCRDDFGSDRIFTETEFTSREDAANEGNASYEDTQLLISNSLPLFYESWFPQVSGGEDFSVPQVQTFDGTAPDCGDMGAEDREIGYCADDQTVYVDETDLIGPAYEEIGDWAVATAVSLPVAVAARDQLGLSTDDTDATISSVCLTGWYTARFWSGDYAESVGQLSPGDVDEAIIFLLTYGQDDAVFPNVEANGFEMVGAFRAGFLEGGTACL